MTDLELRIRKDLTGILERTQPKVAEAVKELVEKGEPVRRIVSGCKRMGYPALTLGCIEAAASYYKSELKATP